MLIWRRLPFRGGLFDDEPQAAGVHWQPDLDVFELPDRFLFFFALPGVGAVPHRIESSPGPLRAPDPAALRL